MAKCADARRLDAERTAGGDLFGNRDAPVELDWNPVRLHSRTASLLQQAW